MNYTQKKKLKIQKRGPIHPTRTLGHGLLGLAGKLLVITAIIVAITIATVARHRQFGGRHSGLRNAKV
jgi:hypothetical protein